MPKPIYNNKDLFEFLEEEIPEDERMYDLYEWGYFKTQRWFEVFKADPEECLYIREMLRNKEELSKPARVNNPNRLFSASPELA